MASSGAIAYSPVGSLALTTFDESSLKELKYHQLLKLASNHNVLKRWSKKQDLIKALLDVKTKDVLPSGKSPVPGEEWRDGKEVFNDMSLKFSGESSSSGRLTFVVENNILQDSRGTYNLTNTSLPGLALNDIDSRLTFNIPKDALKSDKQKAPLKSNVAKKLTVPVSSRSDRRDLHKLPTIKGSPHKLSARSITIKKRDSIKSPMRAMKSIVADNLSARKSMVTVNSSLTPAQKPAPPIVKLSEKSVKMRLPSTTSPVAKIPDNSTMARLTITTTVTRRKSKSDDPAAGRRSLPKATFHSPQTKKTDVTISKQPSRTKLPNFAAMHKRQFEKMDSLDDYMNKKADRIKKLFGTPTKTHQATKENAATAFISQPSPSMNKMLESKKRIAMKDPLLRTRTDVKDKNRSHIHGIRTNKRFELQMKFRNL